jgi:hypothetical protein
MLGSGVVFMSAKALAFLENWIDQNITYLDKGGDYLRAMTLADSCRLNAAKLGISMLELDPTAVGMEKIIHDAMHGRTTPIAALNTAPITKPLPLATEHQPSVASLI